MKFEAKLIGKDKFEKIMFILEPVPQIFIPKYNTINAYLEHPILLSSEPIAERVFVLKDKFKKKLIYEEI